jgi:N utilization substance protein B
MKTPTDPRHLKRRRLVKFLFARSFLDQNFADLTAREIVKHQKTIDDLIRMAAPEWPIEKINKVDLAILRLAVYELKIARKEPPKVIIDEAIELAKEYGSQTSSAFINGTLGTLLKNDQFTRQN